MRYLYSANSITLNYDGETRVIDKTDSRFDAVLNALKEKAYDKVKSIVDGLRTIITNTTGFKVENNIIYIDNQAVNDHIGKRIMDYVNAGLDPSMLVNFWRNLQKNPSSRARERLFLFLENGNHPFTDDGCFIAYKKVRSDMKDTHTGTIDNSVGCKPHMDRNQVDDDPEHTCSRGLHVASWAYAQGYSGQVLIDCKVNPAHVVSIPVDYNNQKMRVTDYEVIALSKGPREELHVSDDLPDIDGDDDEDYDYDGDDDCDDEDIDNLEACKPAVDTLNPEYKQGKEDADALWVYFQSIGQKHTSDSFLKLKRFTNKSKEYMQGVNSALEVLDPQF